MTEWIIPCNIKYYNVVGAFEKLNKLDWKQSAKKAEVGDIVYIYVGSPISAVKFKCRINKVNLPCREIDDTEFVLIGDSYIPYGIHMELELLKKYDDLSWSLEKLRERGLKGNIQGPRRINGMILD